MKKIIGYVILGVFCLPVALLVAFIFWPMAIVPLLGFLFEEDDNFLVPSFFAGICAIIVWLFVLVYLF